MDKFRAFQDAVLAKRVAEKFAGPVVPFKPKTGVPTIAISGKKYVLSTDGGPLGDREDDDDMGWFGRGDGEGGGARVIKTPQGNKWKYLWAYDTEKQYLAMWRVTDGSEKLYNSARSEQARIIKLDKKGQLNRVTNAELRKIEAEMRKREQDAIEAMERSVEEAKEESTKEMDRLVQVFFERFVESKLNRALDQVEKGVVPMGFKPFGPGETDPEARSRQMASYVLGQVFSAEMSLAKVEKFLQSQGVDTDAEGQWVQWAIDDVRDKASDVFLPPRT